MEGAAPIDRTQSAFHARPRDRKASSSVLLLRGDMTMEGARAGPCRPFSMAGARLGFFLLYCGCRKTCGPCAHGRGIELTATRQGRLSWAPEHALRP